MNESNYKYSHSTSLLFLSYSPLPLKTQKHTTYGFLHLFNTAMATFNSVRDAWRDATEEAVAQKARAKAIYNMDKPNGTPPADFDRWVFSSHVIPRLAL